MKRRREGTTVGNCCCWVRWRSVPENEGFKRPKGKGRAECPGSLLVGGIYDSSLDAGTQGQGASQTHHKGFCVCAPLFSQPWSTVQPTTSPPIFRRSALRSPTPPTTRDVAVPSPVFSYITTSAQFLVHFQNMAPTRRVKTARAASQRPPFPPTPSGSEEYSDHDMDPDATYNPSSTHPRASPYHRHSQGAYPLQRGTACLSCRKRKMVRVLVSLDSYPVIRLPLCSLFVHPSSPFSQKCDGSKPVCQQCTKANRAADCEYDDGKSKTRTQLLQEKIQRLESRLHQLEGTPSAQQQNTNPGGPLPYSTSAAGNLVDVSLHSSSLGYGTGHPNPISVYGSPRNTPSPPNRQTYFDENIFSAAQQPPPQFPGDVFLDATSADPLSLGEPLLPYIYPPRNPLGSWQRPPLLCPTYRVSLAEFFFNQPMAFSCPQTMPMASPLLLERPSA